MRLSTLGQTGLSVSHLGFGGAPIGLSGYLHGGDRAASCRRSEAVEAIRAAVAGGVTYFDTAPGYGGGLSEALMGEALGDRRKDIVLATKLSFDPAAGIDDLEERFGQSIARLRTDRIDVLQIHGSQYDAGMAEAILASPYPEFFDRLKARGAIRASGITAETPSGALERLVDSGCFDVLQIAFSVIYQGACDYQRAPFGIIPYARTRGLGIVAMRSLTSGVLQKFMSRAFPDVPDEAVSEAALGFALAYPEIDVVLAGMRTPDEVRRNIALADSSPLYDPKAFHAFYAN